MTFKRLLCYPIWPFFSVREYLCILSAAKRVVDAEGINTIVAVYNPIESLLVGKKIKKLFPNIIFVPYFLDAFYAGSTPKLMPEWIKKRKALRQENFILKDADIVVMMKAAEDVYVNNRERIRFFDKIIFLDLPLYVPSVKVLDHKKRVFFPSSQIVLFFAGALPLNIRHPGYLLEMLHQVDANDLHLYIAGAGDYDNLLKKYSKIDERIHVLGKVDYDLVRQMYLESDILVNIGNTLRYMVPSKIFEYMSLGKPILSTVKIDEDPCIPYLQEYGNALLVKESTTIEENVKILKRFVQTAETNEKLIESFVLNKPSTFVDHISIYGGKHGVSE